MSNIAVYWDNQWRHWISVRIERWASTTHKGDADLTTVSNNALIRDKKKTTRRDTYTTELLQMTMEVNTITCFVLEDYTYRVISKCYTLAGDPYNTYIKRGIKKYPVFGYYLSGSQFAEVPYEKGTTSVDINIGYFYVDAEISSI